MEMLRGCSVISSAGQGSVSNGIVTRQWLERKNCMMSLSSIDWTLWLGRWLGGGLRGRNVSGLLGIPSQSKIKQCDMCVCIYDEEMVGGFSSTVLVFKGVQLVVLCCMHSQNKI